MPRQTIRAAQRHPVEPERPGYLGRRSPAGRAPLGAFPRPARFAVTVFATTDASPKGLMIRGGWKPVAMVVRGEHASEERDALLAEALSAFMMNDNVVTLTHERKVVGARGTRAEGEGGR